MKRNKLRKENNVCGIYKKITDRLLRELNLSDNVSYSLDGKNRCTSIRLKQKTTTTNCRYYLNTREYCITIESSNFHRHPNIQNELKYTGLQISFSNAPILSLKMIPRLVRDAKYFMSIFDYIN